LLIASCRLPELGFIFGSKLADSGAIQLLSVKQLQDLPYGERETINLEEDYSICCLMRETHRKSQTPK
jgi:hypothetical protein